MTLIEEIQKDAVDSKSDLGALLRKCKVLAARLGSRSLEDWLLWESNSYPQDIAVPRYRIWPLEFKGDFSGPFGSGLQNGPIPLVSIPEGVRSIYEKHECRESVAGIEAMLRNAKHGILYVSTGDLAVLLGTNVYEYLDCIKAWGEFPVGCLTECLNSVRNRILDFSLALWKEAPSAGERREIGANGIEPERVTQIFNVTVYGGTASLVGTATNSNIEISVTQNDFASVETTLRANGVQIEDVEELRLAVDEDGRPQGRRFGPRVCSWVARMMKKAADGSWAIGLEAAGNLVAQVLSGYYGL